MESVILAALTESEERIRQDIASLASALKKQVTAVDRDGQGVSPQPVLRGSTKKATVQIASPSDGNLSPSGWFAQTSPMSAEASCSKTPDSTDEGQAAAPGRRSYTSLMKPLHKNSDNGMSVVEEFAASAPPPTHFAQQMSMMSSLGAASRTQNLALLRAGSCGAEGPTATAKFWHAWPANIPLLGEHAVGISPDPHSDLLTVAEKVEGRSFVNLPTLGADTFFESAYRTTNVISMMMIRPDSAFRLTYDAFSMLVLTMDLVFTPYYLAWNEAVPDRVAFPIMAFSTSFWLFDLCMCFFTGCYTKEGLVELRFFKVASNYLKSWFALDFVCVVTDIANVMPIFITGSGSTTQAFSRFIRMIKLVRFLRVLGMLRMVRLIHAVNQFMEAELSDTWRMSIRILQLTAGLIGLVHWCACAWYMVGTHGPAGTIGENWLDMPVGLLTHHEIDSLGAWYQYTLCYQWGLAQISLGAHDIIPINAVERIFTITCNMFGLLFGGTLISILSATLIDIKEINQETASKMQLMREYLLQHNVDIGVRLRVLSQLRERVKARDRVLVEKDVTALEVLSHALLRDLRECIFEEHLLTHAIFRAWSSLDEEILKHIYAEKELSQLFLLPDDELFTSSEVATAGYFLITGHMEYRLESQLLQSSVGANDEQPPSDGYHSVITEDIQTGDGSEVFQVHADTWLSEATWWVMWCHVGTATSRRPCTLMSLSPKAVVTVMSTSLTVHAITAMYARLYHQQLTQAWHRYFELPTDIHVHHSQLSDLIFAMPKHISIILGRAALQQAVSRRGQFQVKSGMKHMEEEIRQGRAVVLMGPGPDACLQRHVALTLLQLMRGTGSKKVLAEIAVYDTDAKEWHVSCRLPGAKQRAEESPLDTLQRVLLSDLGCNFDVQLESKEGWSFSAKREVTASERFGAETTYNKSVFSIPASDSILAHLAASAHRVDGSVALPHMSTQFSPASSNPPRTLQGLHELLMDISEVYVLGTDKATLYAWIDESSIESLAHQKAALAEWVASIMTVAVLL